MRSSILSRSVIGVAALGIGSVALAAAPATAATPSGITRDQVLTAAAGVRSGPVGTGSFIGNNYGPTANRALKAMANRACGIDPDGNDVAVAAVAAATAAGGSADGVVVTAIVFSLDPANTSSGSPQSLCTFAALATTAERSVLSGTATVSGGAPVALSGDAFVTPAVSTPYANGPLTLAPSFTASGSATQTNTVKVKDRKTSKEKKAAKKKYDSRVKSAKKSYAKALDKAGSSKSKKSAAKKAYKAKRASIAAKYRYAIAGYKLTTKKTATPFSVSAQYTAPASSPSQ